MYWLEKAIDFDGGKEIKKEAPVTRTCGRFGRRLARSADGSGNSPIPAFHLGHVMMAETEVIPDGEPLLLPPEEATKWKPSEEYWADHLAPAPLSPKDVADIMGRIVQIGKRMESLGWLSGFVADPPNRFKPTFTDLGKERIKDLHAILSGTEITAPEVPTEDEVAVRVGEISKELFDTLPTDDRGNNLSALRHLVAAFWKAVQGEN